MSDGERPLSADRAHPHRAHPRPVAARSGASGSLKSDVVVKPVRDPGGSGGTRPPVTEPPVTTPPVAPPPVTTSPVARVRVPPVSAWVRPPSVLGRDLPEVRVEAPGTTVEVPARLTARP